MHKVHNVAIKGLRKCRGITFDTPSLAKVDAKVKATWPSHQYPCASHIMTHKP